MAQIDKPNLHFTAFNFTGTGSANTQTGVGFTPDFFWLKNRNAAQGHCLIDVVRGNNNYISSHTTNAQLSDVGTVGIATDGYVFGSGDIFYNGSANNYTVWNWKGGGTGSSNTDGSITSSVSANTTSGFSIVKYTGTGAVATVGHGLGVAPSMIIFKNLSTTDNWNVFNTSQTNGKFIRLNEADAEGNTGRFNNTSPTSSVFSLGVNGANPVNGSGNNIIAYCFANVKGYQKCGSYIGNGNTDGTFIYTGFKPAFYMYKRTDASANWTIFDNKRNTFNDMGLQLHPNLGNAEAFSSRGDFLSNGFKVRSSAGSTNASGGNYIYLAIAESPLVGSNGVPTTAR